MAAQQHIVHHSGGDFGDALLAIAFGVVALFVFYRAVKAEWPDNYMTVDTTGLEYSIISHPGRYVAFRFLPVYLVSVFVAVLLDRAHTDPVVPVFVICAIHIALSSGRSIISLVRSPEGHRQAPLLVMHTGVAVGVVLAGWLALLTRSDLAIFVPSLHELGATLWTAAFAAVLGVFILNASRAQRGTYQAIQRSQEDIPASLYALADEMADRHGADALLVKALMVVKNLQRPRWFRVCERVKGIFFRRGTYGIMQVQSDHPVSDEESIRIAVETRLAGVQIPIVEYSPGYPTYERDLLRSFAMTYNPSPGYADAVATAYGNLWAKRLP